MKRLKISMLSTYPPRMCGIAAFARDLYKAIVNNGADVSVIAISDVPNRYSYNEEVQEEIVVGNIESYDRISKIMNASDVLILQHEFSFYENALSSLLNNVTVPIVSTLHTILAKPPDTLRRLLLEAAQLSDRIVTMTSHGKHVLQEVYGIGSESIAVIPFGTPDISWFPKRKTRLGLEGKKVVLTFGYLAPNKGIHHVLNALPSIVAEHNDVVYVVVGVTHPTLQKTAGDKYVSSLHTLSYQLGMTEHVKFVNRHVQMSELCEYIRAADVIVFPYCSEEQSSSSALILAMACGAAIVSTPFYHAIETLSCGRGVVGEIDQLGKSINSLLNSKGSRVCMQKLAYNYAKAHTWNKIGRRYLETINKLLDSQ